MGRLDLASALIAAVGLIGFFEIRSRAKRAAREEAKKAAAQALPGLLPEVVTEVLADNPNILTSVLRDNPALLGMAIARIEDARNLLYGDIDADEAEEIANTMGGGEDVSP